MKKQNNLGKPWKVITFLFNNIKLRIDNIKPT
jgi:hypothetical protein